MVGPEYQTVIPKSVSTASRTASGSKTARRDERMFSPRLAAREGVVVGAYLTQVQTLLADEETLAYDEEVALYTLHQLNYSVQECCHQTPSPTSMHEKPGMAVGSRLARTMRGMAAARGAQARSVACVTAHARRMRLFSTVATTATDSKAEAQLDCRRERGSARWTPGAWEGPRRHMAKYAARQGVSCCIA